MTDLSLSQFIEKHAGDRNLEAKKDDEPVVHAKSEKNAVVPPDEKVMEPIGLTEKWRDETNKLISPIAKRIDLIQTNSDKTDHKLQAAIAEVNAAIGWLREGLESVTVRADTLAKSETKFRDECVAQVNKLIDNDKEIGTKYNQFATTTSENIASITSIIDKLANVCDQYKVDRGRVMQSLSDMQSHQARLDTDHTDTSKRVGSLESEFDRLRETIGTMSKHPNEICDLRDGMRDIHYRTTRLDAYYNEKYRNIRSEVDDAHDRISDTRRRATWAAMGLGVGTLLLWAFNKS